MAVATMNGGAGLEEDRELLHGFRQGDRDALARIFRRYAREVARSVQRGVRVEVDGVSQRVGGELAAWELENVVQETFMKAFQPRARESYDGVRPFGAWLVTIARNIVIDRARKQRREAAHIVYLNDVEQVAESDDDKSPPALMAARQLSKVVQRFVAGLSDDDRRLFLKRYEDQRSLRQASAELGMGLFELRKRDASLRIALLAELRAEGLMQSADVRIGKSVLDRRGARRKKERA